MATNAGATVGEAIFRCGEAEGFVMATTLFTRPMSGPGVSLWHVYQLAGFVTLVEHRLARPQRQPRAGVGERLSTRLLGAVDQDAVSRRHGRQLRGKQPQRRRRMQ